MADLSGLYPGGGFVRSPNKGGGGGGGMGGIGETPIYNPIMHSEYNAYFDKLEALNPFGAVSWLWSKEVKNLNAVWEASAPEDIGVSVSDITDFGEEELEDLPGASGFTVNTNPKDWLENPGEQAVNILKDSWNTIADWDDFKQRTKREMWGSTGDEHGNGKGMLRDDASPFYIGDNADYEGAVRETTNFMFNNKSAKSRNQNYRKASGEMGYALAKTGNRRADGTLRPGERDGELVSLLQTDGTVFDHVTDSAGNAIGKDVVEGFSAQMDVVQSLEKIDSALGGVKKNLSVELLTTSGKSDVDKKLGQLNAAISKAESAIATAEAHAAMGAHTAFAGQDLAPVKNYVSSLKQKVESHVDVAPIVGGPGTTYAFKAGNGNGLYKTVNIESGRLYRSTADAGIGGRYHSKVVRKNIYNKKSGLNKVIDTTPQVSRQARNLGSVMRAMNRDYDWQTSMDLVNAWDDGKLIDQFVYRNLIRPRIERWTPSYWLKKGIEKTDYFGLKTQWLANDFDVDLSDIPGGPGVVRLSGHASLGNKIGEKDGVTAGILGKVVDKNDPQKLWDALHPTGPTGLKAAEHAALEKSYEYMKKNAAKLGLTLDASGNIADTVLNKEILNKTYRKIHGMKVSTNYLDPGYAKVSIMGKYTVFLNKIQNNVLVKAYNVVGKFQEKIFQKVMIQVGRLLEIAFGTATEGIGLIISWIARILFAKLIKKATEYAKDAFKSLKKGDISMVFEGYDNMFKGAMKLGLWVLAPLITLVILFNFMMGSITSIIPTFDSTKVGGNYAGRNEIDVPVQDDGPTVGAQYP